MRREYARKGWLIQSNGRPWDDWIYPTEEAAWATVENCGVPEATVIFGHRQGIIDSSGRQRSEKLLYDRGKTG